MNDRELGNIASVGVVSILIAFLFFMAIMASGGCATAPKPPPVEIKCGPSNHEKCADKCAVQGRGAPFIVENAIDVACFCKKSGEGT